MDKAIIEQPTVKALSITPEIVTKKIKPGEKSLDHSCLINLMGGVVVGFVCAPLIPIVGPYLTPALIGASAGVISTCTTKLIRNKCVGDRVIVVREQPTNAPDSTIVQVKTGQAPMALTSV